MASIHGTCVEFEGRGVLLLGPPGAGKSDLALRLIEAGGTLVADDRVVLERRGTTVAASAPPELRGLLEVRGLGLRRVPAKGETTLALVVELKPAEEIERLPEPSTVELAGVDLPAVALAAFEASAVAKIRLALRPPEAGRAPSALRRPA